MATTAGMSGLQFDALPYEEGLGLEVLDGDPIDVSSPTPRHQAVASSVLLALRRYLSSRQGMVFPDVEFALSDLLRLRPDVCVRLADTAGRRGPDVIPVPGPPDLAIEVISPTE